MNKIIPIKIRNKISSLIDRDSFYVCGNTDFKVVFEFDDDWEGFRFKTARFTYGGVYQDVVFEGNECSVPRIVGTREIDVGVFADDDAASTPVRVRAKESIVCEGMPDDPPKDVYSQIMELLQYIKENTDLEFIEVNGTNISFNNNYNKVGITKELGTFVCTEISDGRYTFAIEDTSVFTNSTQYRVFIDGVRYSLLSREVNEDSVVFSGNVPFEVGKEYTIVFQTTNATSFGHTNKVYANNGFVTGTGNELDETGDQSSVSGCDNIVSGKNHRVSGYNNIVKGNANNVSGQNNLVEGTSKLVAGQGLISVETSGSSAVLGKYNVDVPGAKFILGCGNSSSDRKNAIVVDKGGKLVVEKEIDSLDLSTLTAKTANVTSLFVNGSSVANQISKKVDSSEVIPNRHPLTLGAGAYANIGGTETCIGTNEYGEINFANPDAKGYIFRDIESFYIPVVLSLTANNIFHKDMLLEGNKTFFDRIGYGDYSYELELDMSGLKGEDCGDYLYTTEACSLSGKLVFKRGIEQGNKYWSWRLLGKLTGVSVVRVGSTKLLPGYQSLYNKIEALENAIIELGGII